MKKPASLSSGSISANENLIKPIKIMEPVEATQCTAAYIAQLTRELAILANGVRLVNLARLLAMAQLEAELLIRRGK